MVGVDTNTSKWILLNSGPQLPLSILADLCCFLCLLSLLLPLSMRKIFALEEKIFVHEDRESSCPSRSDTKKNKNMG